MSYRCGACSRNVAPGTQRLVHVVKRADGNVAREVSVCQECKFELDHGTPLGVLVNSHRPQPVTPPPLVETSETLKPIAVRAPVMAPVALGPTKNGQ